jgi:hypothetical protein
VEFIELDHHINDAEFAEAAAKKLIDLIETQLTSAAAASSVISGFSCAPHDGL